MVALLAGTTVIACQSRDERAVRDWLDGEGFGAVVLTPRSDHPGSWNYVATRDGDACSGRISIARRLRGHSIDDQVSCRPEWNACHQNTPGTCFRLGEILEHGDRGFLDPTARDPTRATGHLTTACNADHARACNSLGVKVAAGSGTPRDPSGAVALFDKACRLGSQYGCSNLSCATTSGSDARRMLLGCAP